MQNRYSTTHTHLCCIKEEMARRKMMKMMRKEKKMKMKKPSGIYLMVLVMAGSNFLNLRMRKSMKAMMAWMMKTERYKSW